MIIHFQLTLEICNGWIWIFDFLKCCIFCLFPYSILQLLNKRYLEKLKEDWWKDKKKCEKIEDQSDGISIQNIGGVFIVIFVGIGMACITLAFEYWWYKYRKATPQITNVTESMGDNPEKMNRKDMGFMNNKDTGDVKNTLLRTRLTKNSEPKF